MQVRELPPLHLGWLLTSPNGGTYRWASDEPDATNVPAGFSFSTSMPGGFEAADLTLPRKQGATYEDLELLSTATCFGAGGDVAWEGRLERAPRTSGDQMAVSPGLVGWQAHLEDDTSAMEIYREADLTTWEGPSMQRRLALGPGLWGVVDPTVASDSTAGPELKLTVTGFTGKPLCETLYRSPVDLGSMCMTSRIIGGAGFAGDAAYDVYVWLCNNDTVIAPIDQSADLGGAQPLTGYTLSATDAGRRFAGFQWYYAGSGSWPWELGLSFKVALYGRHGLTKRGTEPDAGFYASDIVNHAVSTWAPLLTTDIDDSAYIIGHAVFKEPTTPGEIVRQATRFGLQDWGVWEDKTFVWHNRGARGRRWRARIGPSQLSETGASAERLYESVMVRYQDVDGSALSVGPPLSGASVESVDLEDSDPENPANRLGFGFAKRANLQIGIAVSTAAIQIGKRFLEEQKQLNTSGQAQLIGHVEDTSGVKHPAWKVRAGDTIEFVDAAYRLSRRIVRTSYDHASRTVSIDLDAPSEALQVLLERLSAELAVGL